ncbi:hypothetical protein OAG71_02220 [bacterium]|nr:hypothetical protein [bacterium]
MNSRAKIASLIALVVTVAPSVLYFFGLLDAEPVKWISLLGTIAWFVTTPMWMGKEVGEKNAAT